MTTVKFERQAATCALIRKCSWRAVALYEARGQKIDRITVEVVLSAVHANGCPMDFDRLLAADEFTFVNDVTGIVNNINQRNGRLTGHFLPRCARQRGGRL